MQVEPLKPAVVARERSLAPPLCAQCLEKSPSKPMVVPRDRLIPLSPDVLVLTGVCKTTIYGLLEQKLFPEPVRIFSSRMVRWSEQAVLQWVQDRIAGGQS